MGNRRWAIIPLIPTGLSASFPCVDFLTPEAKRLMAVIAKKLGVSQSAVLELAIRQFAKNEGIKDTESKNQ